MIQINELRIGNWVSVDTMKIDQMPKCSFANVIGVGDKIDLLIDGYGENSVSSKVITPVKLTRDILFSCGFEENGVYDNVYQLRNFSITLNKKSKSGMLQYTTNGSNLEIEILSVHQLQNVYFALIGEELEVGLQNKTALL